MLIVVAGKRYKARSIYELDLQDLLDLEAETTALGRPLNLGIMKEMFDEVEAVRHKDPKTQGELRGKHPLSTWTFAINLYCAMRIAGDISTFGEVLKVKTMDVDFLREPGDPDELETLGVQEAAPDPQSRPKRTPKASAQAANGRRRTTQAAKSQHAKSKRASTAA